MYGLNFSHISISACDGVPKTTFRFDYMLGFPELRKVVLFKVIVYYTNRCRSKSAKEKGASGGEQEARHTFPAVLSHWSHVSRT